MFKDWKTGEALGEVYYTGFLVCGQMEGYAVVKGFSKIPEGTYKYLLYKGVLKMNMLHDESATFFHNVSNFDAERARLYENDSDSEEEPIEGDEEFQSIGQIQRHVGGFVANQKEGLVKIYESIKISLLCFHF